jgi:hypothetical protein
VSTEHRLAPPSGERRPLKQNVFQAAQISNTQLCPIFPYLGQGAMVPGVAVTKAGYRGGPAAPVGNFYHFNSVDEVLLLFAPFPGVAAVGGRMHPVGDSLGDDPNAYSVAVITQRQVDEGPQHEEYLLRCEECRHQLVRERKDFDPADADASVGPAVFEALPAVAEAFARYNEDESLRTCSKCGHINERFPLEKWGWEAYAHQGDAARRGRADLEQFGAAAFQ